jgi:hypothetical protein
MIEKELKLGLHAWLKGTVNQPLFAQEAVVLQITKPSK